MRETLTPGDGQDILARFKRARQKRDPDKMVELYAQDAEYRYDPFEPPLTGVNAIREHWNEIAAEQVHVDFEAERVWVVGRTVLSHWHAAYTRRGTADRIRVRGFSTMELDEENRISRFREWAISRAIGKDSKFKPEPASEDAGEERHG
ncbi:MAG: nuclear transport factor 2 family protein [Chloroflexota bacterium]